MQSFICWKISDYSFDFHACDGSVKIFYFFLVQFWSYTFLRMCPFLPSYPFYWHIVPESSVLWSFVGEGNGTPLQYSCLENPMDGGAWRAAVHGVAKSRTWLSGFTFTFHFSLSCIGEGNGNPLQCSCLENPRDRGTWWVAVHGVAQSWTQLKRLSSSSSSMILCISVLSVVISPFSFLILLIWFFSLFFLMSLTNGLSILLIFSKNHLLVLLILL